MWHIRIMHKLNLACKSYLWLDNFHCCGTLSDIKCFQKLCLLNTDSAHNSEIATDPLCLWGHICPDRCVIIFGVLSISSRNNNGQRSEIQLCTYVVLSYVRLLILLSSLLFSCNVFFHLAFYMLGALLVH